MDPSDPMFMGIVDGISDLLANLGFHLDVSEEPLSDAICDLVDVIQSLR